MVCLDTEQSGNWDKSVAKMSALRISKSVNCWRSWSISLSFLSLIPKLCNVIVLSLGLINCCVFGCASVDVNTWSLCTYSKTGLLWGYMHGNMYVGCSIMRHDVQFNI